MDDAMTTFVKRNLDDHTNRLATMERHLHVLDENRATLVADIERTKQSIAQSKDMLGISEPPAKAPLADKAA